MATLQRPTPSTLTQTPASARVNYRRRTEPSPTAHTTNTNPFNAERAPPPLPPRVHLEQRSRDNTSSDHVVGATSVPASSVRWTTLTPSAPTASRDYSSLYVPNVSATVSDNGRSGPASSTTSNYPTLHLPPVSGVRTSGTSEPPLRNDRADTQPLQPLQGRRPSHITPTSSSSTSRVPSSGTSSRGGEREQGSLATPRLDVTPAVGTAVSSSVGTSGGASSSNSATMGRRVGGMGPVASFSPPTASTGEAQAQVQPQSQADTPLQQNSGRPASQGSWAWQKLGRSLFGGSFAGSKSSPGDFGRGNNGKPWRERKPWTVRQASDGNFVVTVSKNTKQSGGVQSVSSVATEIGVFSTEHEGQMAGEAFSPPIWEEVEKTSRCALCQSSFGLLLKRKHHCRNCGHLVCSACTETQWPSTMLPFTFHVESGEKSVRVCEMCQQTVEKFRAALLQGDEESTMAAYSTGCINLRSPFMVYHNELPVHCAAAGGNLNLLAWLVDDRCCPIFANKEKTIALGDGKKQSVMAVAALGGNVPMMRFLLFTQGCRVTEVTDMKALWTALDNTLREGANIVPANQGRRGGSTAASAAASTAAAASSTPPVPKEDSNKTSGTGSARTSAVSSFTSETGPLVDRFSPAFTNGGGLGLTGMRRPPPNAPPLGTWSSIGESQGDSPWIEGGEMGGIGEGHWEGGPAYGSWAGGGGVAAQAVEVAGAVAEAEDDCIVCFERPVSCTLVPCGHHCCCLECAAQFTTCPVCRSPVEQKIRTIRV